ncbi:MAG TPA: EAL domain-containing protein [Solirubrobacteraceae bacterium]|nr:EAL domain-containing protein [Solirubrobacteraceae bacterium]
MAGLLRRRAGDVLEAERRALVEAQAVALLGSWSLPLDGGPMQVSEEYLRLYDTTRENVLAQRHLKRIHPDDRPRARAARDRLLTGEAESMDETYRVEVPGNPEQILHAVGRVETDGERRAVGTVQDITDLEHARRGRARAEERFRVAFEQGGVPTALISLDARDRGRLLNVNSAYADLLGVPLDELRGAHLREWIAADDLESGFEAPLSRLANGVATRQQYERRLLRGDGVVFTVVTDAVVHSPEDVPMVIEQALGISERKRSEGELRHLADHDALTGLFNRRRFEEELDRAIAHSRRYGAVGAVLALDLDGFKYVNDALGHPAGDHLVTRLAGTLRQGLRETDVIARTGGDEFAVILPGASESDACTVAEKLLSDLRASGSISEGERRAQVSGSIGITLFGPGETATSDDLLVEADIAMYDAKAAGRDRLSVFQRGHPPRARVTSRQDWLERLRVALRDERLVLWAQPIVPVCAEAGLHYELLLRMPGDNDDLLPPGAFLDNAERFGLTALLERLLERYTIPRGSLVLELAETAAITNVELVPNLARDVRRLGVRVALDGFGAGLATFYSLKHLSFDIVKLDREFICHLTENRADQLVVASVVNIARGLGAPTVAEFVQDDATLALLHDLGVDYAQGFHTGRPAPVARLLPALP